MTARSRKFRQAIVHIGVEKTGTTSLQSRLDANRAALAARGILFPKSLGPVNHTGLVAACLDTGVIDTIKGHYLAQTGLDEAAFRRHVTDTFAQECRDSPADDTLLISSELVHSRLLTKSEIARLLDLVSTVADTVRIVVMLRRQDRLAVSRFSTALRSGHAAYDDLFGNLAALPYLAAPPDRQMDDRSHYYDFEALIGRFTEHLGDGAVRVLTFDGGTGTDPVDRMAGLMGLAPEECGASRSRLNLGLSDTAQRILARLNRDLPKARPDGSRDKAARAIRLAVETEHPGPPRVVREADAAAFLADFAAGNARLAERFDLGPSLFDADFVGYADPPAPPMDAKDLDAIAADYLARYQARPEHKRGAARLWARISGARTPTKGART